MDLKEEEEEEWSDVPADTVRWRSFDLGKRSDKTTRQTLSSEALESALSLKKKPGEDGIAVGDLKPGDVIFVLKKSRESAVAASQRLSKLLIRTTSAVARRACAELVHVMVVVESSGLHARIAHVVTGGGALAYIEDPVDTDKVKEMGVDMNESKTSLGLVYRLECTSLATLAAQVAQFVLSEYSVDYGTSKSIRSAFKKSHLGSHLEHRDKTIFKFEDKHISLFCSEFVIKCFQEALAQMEDQTKALEWIKAVDLKASSSTPMIFEAFLRENDDAKTKWKTTGKLNFDFM